MFVRIGSLIRDQLKFNGGTKLDLTSSSPLTVTLSLYLNGERYMNEKSFFPPYSKEEIKKLAQKRLSIEITHLFILPFDTFSFSLIPFECKSPLFFGWTRFLTIGFQSQEHYSTENQHLLPFDTYNLFAFG